MIMMEFMKVPISIYYLKLLGGLSSYYVVAMIVAFLRSN